MPKHRNAGRKVSGARMVDVGDKAVTLRIACARATVRLSASTLSRIEKGLIPKGDVFTVARVAGIQAAKDTSRFLPLCHPLPLEGVDIDFSIQRRPARIRVESIARANWKTGVEMEALVAVAAASLTIYDMCKALEKGISIERMELVEKSGGRSGRWVRK